MSTWKEIWGKKKLGDCDNSDFEDLFLKMKIAVGYDSMGELSITFEDFKKQYDDIMKMLCNSPSGSLPVKSVYEVGCGTGANLLLMKKNGYEIGGCDYSESLIEGAKRVFGPDQDITVCEAKDMPVKPLYDASLCKGVFSYFGNEDYAIQVMDKMYEKSRYSIGILGVKDIEKKDKYVSDRRKMVPDYDSKYVGLEKLFVSRDFFKEFAHRNSMEIVITDENLNGYWNNEYSFDVYMYKL